MSHCGLIGNGSVECLTASTLAARSEPEQNFDFWSMSVPNKHLTDPRAGSWHPACNAKHTVRGEGAIRKRGGIYGGFLHRAARNAELPAAAPRRKQERHNRQIATRCGNDVFLLRRCSRARYGQHGGSIGLAGLLSFALIIAPSRLQANSFYPC